MPRLSNSDVWSGPLGFADLDDLWRFFEFVQRNYSQAVTLVEPSYLDQLWEIRYPDGRVTKAYVLLSSLERNSAPEAGGLPGPRERRYRQLDFCGPPAVWRAVSSALTVVRKAVTSARRALY